jgi:hypothetical protein
LIFSELTEIYPDMKFYSHGTGHLVAVDCIIFGYDLVEKEIKVLLFRELLNRQKASGLLPEDSLRRTKVWMLRQRGF